MMLAFLVSQLRRFANSFFDFLCRPGGRLMLLPAVVSNGFSPTMSIFGDHYSERISQDECKINIAFGVEKEDSS
jgi:hypothetical protein